MLSYPITKNASTYAVIGATNAASLFANLAFLTPQWFRFRVWVKDFLKNVEKICGAKVCLLEKTIFPGGLATTGCILHYLPLSDCRGNQVTFGISEELLHASLKYGPGDVPEGARGVVGLLPGQAPYHRGCFPQGYRTKPWRIFQLSGFGGK